MTFMNSPVSAVSPSQGLHFVISDQVPPFEVPKESNCLLHILHRFPPDVFVDPYELEQRVLDKISPPFKVWGETDLELPVSAVSEGSLLLLGPVTTGEQVDVPIHTRYPLPSWTSSHASVTLDNPTLLLVCDRRESCSCSNKFRETDETNRPLHKKESED
jgi:GPI mannosyltransferase 1 subunit X